MKFKGGRFWRDKHILRASVGFLEIKDVEIRLGLEV